ncbi:UDP-glucose 4-epimerase GalE [Solibacillus sp. CAU 1738]|uniref:UDP-glucose 4-epimerase GalE n=1 Tax=Solibacillus sp. CAU 1738 TaxID=3140363 RepID=UPI0032603A53
MTILVTGGLGFIGSHTVVSVLKQYDDILIIDRHSNPSLLSKLEILCNRKIPFKQVDLLDKMSVQNVFQTHNISMVIHFAALKSLSQSYKFPLEYYTNNITGTLNLLEVMQMSNVKKLVFSSSAIVYGNNSNVPLTENEPLSVNNPYAQTKLMVEQMLTDISISDPEWSILALRYFNPTGAHSSGLIGEKITKDSSNLMPHIMRVAAREQDCLSIFGDNYDTHDGTCIRDYIHIMDLAEGHVKALQYIEQGCGFDVINLGTGQGVSVLDLVHTFMEITKVDIPYIIVESRQGDIAKSYACIDKAKERLGWTAKFTLEDMCRDAWNWKVSEASK